ncbi:Cnl2/NKP2 family protein-domain-containing protein [Lineolata rhizophorae]|uniref:Cnl2/NKP2 family protein-domain-containing protein n=1 Tax=Lineolata rhizophorae TaxID=578093 RepID=A0A6A6P9T5_9PEZI|nr:Cnl2/NKP2 family protein-domain-containing protein [Lineolata rhizophorae]
MAPTEASILSSFLLSPAPLPTFLTLRQFKELFPRSQQSDPQIQTLYRELQHQRAIDIDDVRRHIAAEVKRGKRQKRSVVEGRRKMHDGDFGQAHDRETRMELELSGALGQPTSEEHTPETIVPAMESARSQMEAEVVAMESEAKALMEDVGGIISDLSDLRYGRFNRVAGSENDLGQEVVEDLARLVDICKQSLSESYVTRLGRQQT